METSSSKGTAESTSVSVCLSPRSLFKKWLTLKRSNTDQCLFTHTFQSPDVFQQENTEFRLCAETCMLQPCLKLYVSPTPTSQLSQSSLWADLAACAGAGRGTEPAAVCWHLHRHQPSSTPLSNLQDGAGRLAWQV